MIVQKLVGKTTNLTICFVKKVGYFIATVLLCTYTGLFSPELNCLSQILVNQVSIFQPKELNPSLQKWMETKKDYIVFCSDHLRNQTDYGIKPATVQRDPKEWLKQKTSLLVVLNITYSSDALLRGGDGYFHG